MVYLVTLLALILLGVFYQLCLLAISLYRIMVAIEKLATWVEGQKVQR